MIWLLVLSIPYTLIADRIARYNYAKNRIECINIYAKDYVKIPKKYREGCAYEDAEDPVKKWVKDDRNYYLVSSFFCGLLWPLAVSGWGICVFWRGYVRRMVRITPSSEFERERDTKKDLRQRGNEEL